MKKSQNESLCLLIVALSCGGTKIFLRPLKIMFIRENSSLVCQIQTVKIKPNTAYPRTKKVYK